MSERAPTAAGTPAFRASSVAASLPPARGKAKRLGLRCNAAKFLGAWDGGNDADSTLAAYPPRRPSPSRGEGEPRSPAWPRARYPRAFSSDVETGSRQGNATSHQSRVTIRIARIVTRSKPSARSIVPVTTELAPWFPPPRGEGQGGGSGYRPIHCPRHSISAAGNEAYPPHASIRDVP